MADEFPEITAPELHRKPGLYLKDTKTAKGRGVFCTHDIEAGEELEVTPALILNDADTELADQSVLLYYTFSTGKLSKSLREKSGIRKLDKTSAVIMGVASFCNHDESPNAEILWEEIDGSLYYTLRATAFIPKGVEICTTYGDSWFSERSF